MPSSISLTANPAIVSRYTDFDRDAWRGLRANTPLLLNEQELAALRGINEQVHVREVEDTYIPLSRFLNLQVDSVRRLQAARRQFMGSPMPVRVPYVIGIAGSVAVGKSTFSRVLRACLARWPEHPRVDLVTTDGFLYPNRILEERGLMERKGFPESYDTRRLLQFLADLKAGKSRVSAPVYSHLHYDIVPGRENIVEDPDILIIEGLNVLQSSDTARVFVSDFFDFSIYLHAEEAVIEDWYIARFLKLRESVFSNPESYFHRFASLTDTEAIDTARSIWRRINLRNLHENILPTRERAHAIFEKAPDHAMQRVRLRWV